MGSEEALKPMTHLGWDLFVQCSNQELAARFVSYFHDPQISERIFPERMALHAEEMGPRTNHTGPCLAVFKGLRISPEEFLAWLDKCPFIKRHVCRTFFFPPGHRVFPCRDSMLQDIISANTSKSSTRISAHPKTLEAFLGEKLPESFRLQPQNFQEVLMATGFGDEYRWSRVPPTWLFRVPSTESKLFEGSVAAAVNKIHEALHVTGLNHQRLDAVIDVGSAPGSWVKYLVTRANTVIAVDPAELAADVLSTPNVHHIKKLSEDPAVAQFAEEVLCGRAADLITCDMNGRPTAACKAVQPLLKFLKPGGHIVLTLKNKGMGRDRTNVLNAVLQELEGVFEEHRCMWLMANTKFEATYVGRRTSARIPA